MSGMTRKVALIGARGMLAKMVQAAAPSNFSIQGFQRPEFDLTDVDQVRRAMEEFRPQVIINCCAYTQVDRCEDEEELATRVNGEGPGYLAVVARELDATLVHVSTDYVFSGNANRPYRENDATGPMSAYGRSKLKGEQAILESGLEKYFIVRTSWLYGPWGKNFVETILRLAAEREELRIVADQVGCPTYTGDLAEAIFRLLELESDSETPAVFKGEYGVYHFANEGQCSWYDFACEIVEIARQIGLPVKAHRIEPITTEQFPLPAQRPTYSVFDTAKYQKATGVSIPSWQESLKTYFEVR
ncbi:dTDP-4-dehydrorhamnose reductase [Syntrophotalea acetylenivorans]|uniref:dTDP-4-dehydrorhamnose reductase n=1 Tax=Syntrophotalea acetylenivorans TaxID=1842532 RepID=A0A1L3GL67_9BACT|nr:dTDP-4-dehydrorhamnose reductase [Syntrophotalea acetylenivorans]APG26640.1 dTDP-4-dehydrorhamnose reductase [Syntrophotalea acetylenivorans]